MFNPINGGSRFWTEYQHSIGSGSLIQLVLESGCKTLKDYHDLYLKTDVLLLADFFEKFRRMCMKSYGLDAARYYSAPGMAWDAALKMTKVKTRAV